MASSGISLLVSNLTDSLQKCGFIQSYADYALFNYAKIGVFPCILIYIDDLLITANNVASLPKYKSYMHSCFQIKDLSHLKYFLGIKIARSKHGIYLSQHEYALKIIF